MRTYQRLGPWQRFVLWLAKISNVGHAAAAVPPAPGIPETNRHEPGLKMTLILDSRDEHLKFTVHLRVRVRCDGQGVLGEDARQVANAGLRNRAHQVTRRYSILQAEEVHADLVLELRRMQPVGDSGVAASASCEEVTVNENDKRMLSRYHDVLRARYLARFETEVDEYALRNFGSLLSDPYRATAWWFSKHPDKTKQLPEVAQDFLEVQACLKPTVAVEGTDSFGNILDDFLTDVDDAGVEFISMTLPHMLKEYERDDLQQRWDEVSSQRP